MTLKLGRRRWWLTIVTIGILGGGLVVLPDLVPDQVPASEPFTLRANVVGVGGDNPLFGPPVGESTPIPIPECGDTVLSATTDPEPAYVDEPFTVSLRAVTADACTLRAQLEVVGGRSFTVSPSRVVVLAATGSAPVHSTWTLGTDAPGRGTVSIIILARDGDDVVATISGQIQVEPSRRLDEGTEWLRDLLGDTTLEASTIDGSALRAGRRSTLSVVVRGPEPGQLTEGLDQRATLNTCVEASGAGVSDQRCWDSSVDLSQLIEIEEHVPVHAEHAGQVSMVANVTLTGRVDGATTDPVRASFRGASGTASVTVVDRLRTVEQTVVRWLAAAGGIALVAGVISSLTKRVKDRLRRRAPRPADVLDDAIDQTNGDREVAVVGEDEIDPGSHRPDE